MHSERWVYVVLQHQPDEYDSDVPLDAYTEEADAIREAAKLNVEYAHCKEGFTDVKGFKHSDCDNNCAGCDHYYYVKSIRLWEHKKSK